MSAEYAFVSGGSSRPEVGIDRFEHLDGLSEDPLVIGGPAPDEIVERIADDVSGASIATETSALTEQNQRSLIQRHSSYGRRLVGPAVPLAGQRGAAIVRSTRRRRTVATDGAKDLDPGEGAGGPLWFVGKIPAEREDFASALRSFTRADESRHTTGFTAFGTVRA